MQSDLGEQTWNAHQHFGVTIVDSQAEWTPLQRNFLALAHDEHEPDPPKTPNTNTSNL